MSDMIPAEAFHPGEFLKDSISDGANTGKHWDKLIAEGLTQGYLERLVSGDARITPMSARQIGKALGTGAIVWLNLQDQFDKWQERPD